MNPNQIFSIVNALALVGWILLIVLPRRRWAADVAARSVMPGVFAVMYVAIVAPHWLGSSGGFSTLLDVATLFSQPWLLLAGWIHYLAFDLFVGGWEVRDARERGIPHLATVPSLALTFMFGPAGWLSYACVRALHASRSLPREIE